MLGGDDSTVMGIIFWSPTSDARVGGCLQSESISQKQGKFLFMQPLEHTPCVCTHLHASIHTRTHPCTHTHTHAHTNTHALIFAPSYPCNVELFHIWCVCIVVSAYVILCGQGSCCNYTKLLYVPTLNDIE